MTDYNLKIKLLRTKSAFMSLLEERELVIVDDNGIGQASTDSSLKVYDPDKTDIKQLYKTMKKPTKFTIEQPQAIQEGTTYFDKTDCTLKRYNGTNWEIIGRTIDLDNNLGGVWTRCISIPILTPPSEDIQYKIEINGDNILVYSNDGTTVLASGNGGLDFWDNVQSDGKDIRICNENYEQNYFWIESFDYTNKKTIIWVRLNVSQSELNIAYNNDDCLVSNYCNGNIVFEFFDDFNDGIIDSSKWQQVIGAGTVKEENGYLEISANGYDTYLLSSNTFNPPYIVETKFMIEYGANGLCFLAQDANNMYMHQVNADPSFAKDCFLIQVVLSGIANLESTPYTGQTVNTNVWYHEQAIINSDEHILRLEDNEPQSWTPTQTWTSGYVGFGAGLSEIVRYDYYFIRKYLSSSLSFGTPTVKAF